MTIQGGYEANKKGLFSLFVFGNADLLDRCHFGDGASFKLLDASCGVHNLCLSGVKRVAVIADIDIKLVLGRSNGGLVAAYAAHFRDRVVFWVDFCLHNSDSTIRCNTRNTIGF